MCSVRYTNKGNIQLAFFFSLFLLLYTIKRSFWFFLKQTYCREKIVKLATAEEFLIKHEWADSYFKNDVG